MNAQYQEYEILSGCGARQVIKATSLRGAKIIATARGFSNRFTVWIQDSTGKILAWRDCEEPMWNNNF